jgi:putative transposon-encoded protein
MESLPKSANPPPGIGAFGMASQDFNPKAKFEVYGEEMIDKCVKPSGKSGRIYLPPEWVGKNVKVIRLD